MNDKRATSSPPMASEIPSAASKPAGLVEERRVVPSSLYVFYAKVECLSTTKLIRYGYLRFFRERVPQLTTAGHPPPIII